MINDMKNMKESGSASVAELREFLKSLKARNPQEVIGMVSSSLLIQSLGLSCVATAAILFVFTVGPYMIYGAPQTKGPAAKATVAAATTPSGSSNSPTDATAATGAASTGATSAAGMPDAEKAAKVMGLDETKAADPKKNPLDKPDLDKLLDGL